VSVVLLFYLSFALVSPSFNWLSPF
jgi:hypothetical protein